MTSNEDFEIIEPEELKFESLKLDAKRDDTKLKLKQGNALYNVSFLIDTSGSMGGQPLQWAKQIAIGTVEMANKNEFGSNFIVDAQDFNTTTSEYMSARLETVDPVTGEPFYPGRMGYKSVNGKFVQTNVYEQIEKVRFTKRTNFPLGDKVVDANVTYEKQRPRDPVEYTFTDVTSRHGGKVKRLAYVNKRSKTDTSNFILPEDAKKEIAGRMLCSKECLDDFTSRTNSLQTKGGTDLRMAAGLFGRIVARCPQLVHEDGTVQPIHHILVYLTDDQDTVSTTTNSVRNLFRSWTPQSDNTIPTIIVVRIGSPSDTMLATEADFLIDCKDANNVKSAIKSLYDALVDISSWKEYYEVNEVRNKALSIKRSKHSIYVAPGLSTSFLGPKNEKYELSYIDLIAGEEKDNAMGIAAEIAAKIDAEVLAALLEVEQKKSGQMKNTEQNAERYRRRKTYGNNAANHTQAPDFLVVSVVEVSTGKQLIAGASNNVSDRVDMILG